MQLTNNTCADTLVEPDIEAYKNVIATTASIVRKIINDNMNNRSYQIEMLNMIFHNIADVDPSVYIRVISVYNPRIPEDLAIIAYLIELYPNELGIVVV